MVTQQKPLIAISNHDAVLLGLIQKTFEDDGYRTMLLPTGSAGYNVVKEYRPDLIMLDTWLQNESGAWLLLQILRMDPETKHIPVLLTTAEGGDFAKRADSLPKESGIDLIAKPYDQESILEKARAALARR
jgi:DNA-binding response OmpR family regulator